MGVMGDDDSNYANHNNHRQFSGYFLRHVGGGNRIHAPPMCVFFRVFFSSGTMTRRSV